MSKFYLIIPIFTICLVQNTFSNPYSYNKDNFVVTRQNTPQLKRKNQIIFDRKINNDKMYNDYVVIDKDNYGLQQVKDNYKRDKEQYNGEKRQYESLIDNYHKEINNSQEIQEQYKNVIDSSNILQKQFNEQKEVINNLNSKIEQDNAKIKLRENFIKVFRQISECRDLKNAKKINKAWKQIIEDSIVKQKINKQYIKNIWKRIYNIYKNDLNINKYNIKIKQLEILNLNKAMNFIDSYYNLNEILQKIISTILKFDDIEIINRCNKVWDSTIKLAINENKLSKEDIKSIWKVLYNKNIKLLEDKIIYLWYNNNNEELYEQISKTNLFDLDSAMRFIDAI